MLLRPTSRGNVLQCIRATYATKKSSSDPAASDVEEAESDTEATTSAVRESSFCDVTLLGRLGTPPKRVQVAATGSDFVTFVVGTTYQTGGTKWHEVNVNRPVTKKWLLDSVDVGDRVYIKGKLSYTQEPNAKHYRILAEEVKMINRSKKNLEKLLESREKQEKEK